MIALTFAEEEEILTHLRAWGFYRKVNKKTTEYYCTSCHEWRDTVEKVKHNEQYACRYCGRMIDMYAIGYPHGGLDDTRNFVLIRPDTEYNNVTLSCIRAKLHYQNRDDDDLEPELDCWEPEQYRISIGKVQRYIRKDDGKLHRTKKVLQEPCHFDTWRRYYNNNTYTVIGMDNIDKTFLTRSHIREYIEEHDGRYFVSALVFYAQHPNIEILWETGFEKLAAEIYDSREIPQQLNLKSNNIKKILGVDTKLELEYLTSAEISKRDLWEYREFKAAFSELSPDQCAECWGKYSSVITALLAIKAKAPTLTYKKIDNYLEKQAEIATLACRHAFPRALDMLTMWRDMLFMAASLNYDMSDSAVVRPKNLREVHDRLVKLDIDAKQKIKNETTKKQFEKLSAKYAPLRYSKYGLQVIIPGLYGDIIAEGAALSHCVGSYANDYADGKTIIVFVRNADAPETPYYTMEINIDTAEIVQFYGYKNNVVAGGGEIKPLRIRKFQKRYQKYLDSVKIDGIFQSRKNRRISA